MKSINNFIGLALLSGALLTSCSDSFFLALTAFCRGTH